jgi:hypothetical protein
MNWRWYRICYADGTCNAFDQCWSTMLMGVCRDHVDRINAVVWIRKVGAKSVGQSIPVRRW